MAHALGVRRSKVFGEGRCVPLDRNSKARIFVLARALSRRTEPGKAYGEVTAKFLAVLHALLYGFHNAHTGRCFPSYETIADKAGCSRTTVYEAIRALERVGLLRWVNRLLRVRERCEDLFGKDGWRWRVVRTSNQYELVDPQPQRASEFNSKTGTTVQDFNLFCLSKPRETEVIDEGLAAALARLKAAISEG